MALLDTALRDARPEDDRISADPPEAVRLAGICGGLPLALQITAALLKADPSRTVSDLADELGDEIRRLKALRYDDGSGTSAPSVAAAFELSYRQLDEAAARVFRLLPVNPGPDVVYRSGRSTGGPAGQRRTQSDRPAGQGASGRGSARYDGSVADARLAAAVRRSSYRMLTLRRTGGNRPGTGCCSTTWTCANAADAHLRALPDTAVPAAFTGRDDALAWLDAERPNLIAARRHGGHYWQRPHRHAATDQSERVPGHTSSFRRPASHRYSEPGCRSRLGNQDYEAIALTTLGTALNEVGRVEEAITAHQDAAAIFRETGDRRREAMARNNLGIALRQAGRFEQGITAHQDAAAIYREIGDRNYEGTALGNLANALRQADQVRAGDHRVPGRGGDFPGNRRPAARGHGAT